MKDKIIVTHHHPDLDALTCIWLIKRFLSGFASAQVKFVPSGQTYRMVEPDIDSDILHVDTGLGELDHHQKRAFTSAAKKTLAKVSQSRDLKKLDKEALKRLVAHVTEIDNGRDIGWPEAEDDRYEFMLHNILLHSPESQEIWETSLLMIDKIFQNLKNKIHAEKIIHKKGIVFETRFGKSVAILTGNDQILYIGQKIGYSLVAKKDKRSGHLRIFGRFDRKVDLRRAFKVFQKKDPKASWYLHQSRCLIINSSKTNLGMKATKLSLPEIIEILKKA
ncbi:MAG: chromate resistance protein [bacterium]|nr:chromate resistance protein [bacterium]